MSNKNIMKFIVGLTVVSLLCGGLLLYMNYTMTRVSSSRAKLNAQYYVLGADYSGTITKQYAKNGDTVVRGDKMFTLKSSNFAEAFREQPNKTDYAFDITADNQILLKATDSGVVSEVLYNEGDFVAANSAIARVQKDGTMFVEAYYKLAPPDYARVKNGSEVKVTLPNNHMVTAKVYAISITSIEGETLTVVKALLDDQLKESYAFGPETPVDTTLILSGKTLYDSLRETLKSLVNPGAVTGDTSR